VKFARVEVAGRIAIAVDTGTEIRARFDHTDDIGQLLRLGVDDLLDVGARVAREGEVIDPETVDSGPRCRTRARSSASG
jgi:hypothetical protein